MSLIAVSQRVEVDSQFGERRDCLDRLWTKFMMACGLTLSPLSQEVGPPLSCTPGLRQTKMYSLARSSGRSHRPIEYRV